MASLHAEPFRILGNGLGRNPPGVLREAIAAVESQFADRMERWVAGEGFSTLLVAVTENYVAMWKLNADLWDSTWRVLRVPGRADLDRLAAQMARTEDKLEMVLQAVEALQDARGNG